MTNRQTHRLTDDRKRVRSSKKVIYFKAYFKEENEDQMRFDIKSGRWTASNTCLRCRIFPTSKI